MRYSLLLILSLFLTNLNFAQEVNCKEDFFPAYSEKSKMYGYKNMAGVWRIRPFYTQAYTFYGKCAVVMKGTKYGVINCKGMPIVQPIYDKIKAFKRGTAWVKQGTKWGLVSDEGKLLLPCELDSVLDVNKFSRYTWVQKGGVWGIYDKDATKYIFSPQFQEFVVVSDEVSFVKKDFFTGVIKHESEKYIVEPSLERIIRFSNSCFGALKNDKWAILNREGVFLKTFMFDSLGLLTSSRLIAKTKQGFQVLNMDGNPINSSYFEEVGAFKSGIFRVKEKGVYTYMNFYGNMLNMRFKEASDFNLFRAIVKTDSGECVLNAQGEIISKAYKSLNHVIPSVFVASNDKGKFLLNRDGERLSDIAFLDIDPDSAYMICRKDLNEYVYYNVKDDTLYEKSYLGLTKFQKDFACVKNDQKWNLIDTDFNVLFSGYDSILITNDKNVFIVKNGKKWGSVSKEGKELIPLEHDGLKFEGIYVYEHKHKFGLINLKGEILVKASWDSLLVNPAYENWIVCKKKKYNIIDLKKGTEKLEKPVSELHYFKNGFFKVKSDQFWGVLNQYGKPVLPELFDEIADFSEHLFLVKNSKGWGYANETGKFRIGCQFENATPFQGGVAVVSNWGKYYVIDLKEQKLSVEFDALNQENNLRILKSKDKELVVTPEGTFLYRGIN